MVREAPCFSTGARGQDWGQEACRNSEGEGTQFAATKEKGARHCVPGKGSQCPYCAHHPTQPQPFPPGCPGCPPSHTGPAVRPGWPGQARGHLLAPSMGDRPQATPSWLQPCGPTRVVAKAAWLKVAVTTSHLLCAGLGALGEKRQCPGRTQGSCGEREGPGCSDTLGPAPQRKGWCTRTPLCHGPVPTPVHPVPGALPTPRQLRRRKGSQERGCVLTVHMAPTQTTRRGVQSPTVEGAAQVTPSSGTRMLLQGPPTASATWGPGGGGRGPTVCPELGLENHPRAGSRHRGTTSRLQIRHLCPPSPHRPRESSG